MGRDGPSYLLGGTLHVGRRTVELGEGVDRYVVGATGAYWVGSATLMVTAAADATTRKVADVRWDDLAVSADRTVLATVDQSRGPTDRYGTHVMQVAAFDARTGEQLCRTPDREPERAADLTDLYGEVMPLLQGVSTERLFFDGRTIDLADGSSTRAGKDPEGVELYAGYADTLFPGGYRVGIGGEGSRRVVTDSEAYGVGRLSPDRSTLFDVGSWPTEAVAHDASTGRRRVINAPWDHFVLATWVDRDTFTGIAQEIDEDAVDDVVRRQQVVTCEVRTLRCTPVSPVARTDSHGDSPRLLVEGAEGA